MHLYVALVPQASVCEAVAEVVRNADQPLESPPAAVRSAGRWRKREDEPVRRPGHPQLNLVPADQMQLPIATFGNVTQADAERLGQAVRRAAATLAAPTVHLEGSAALEFPGDQSVWARVEGDLEMLRLIPPGMTKIVESLGFYVDRRQFRPMLSVATITDATDIEVLQRVVDALEAFRGESWTVATISLRQRLLDTHPAGSREIAEIPFATGQ